VRKCAIFPETGKVQQISALGARSRCPLLLENLMPIMVEYLNQGRMLKRIFFADFQMALQNMQRLANLTHMGGQYFFVVPLDSFPFPGLIPIFDFDFRL